MPRILLVEPEQLLRSALRALLCESPGFSVVAEVGDAQAAVSRQARSKADIGIVGAGEREPSALLAELLALRAGLPALPLLMIARCADRRMISRVMGSGVVGFLLRSATPSTLEQAVRQVAQGRVFVDPSMPPLRPSRSKSLRPDPRLTPRQRQVLQLVVAGKSSKEIAAALGLSAKTVETYRTQLMQRMGVHDVASLVRRALQDERWSAHSSVET